MIHVGTCGYGDYRPGEGWKERYSSKLEAYADAYSLLELNRTFYSLPMEKTAARWRSETGESLQISVKAWQAITHPTDSPTWRKRKGKLSEKQLEEFGNLGWNDSVRDAWEKTLTTAQAVEARTILIQTPAKFGCTEENETRVRDFFSRAAESLETSEKSGVQENSIRLAWEPRGDWLEHPDFLASIFEEYGLIHAHDVLRRGPLSNTGPAYVRLHGLGRREFDYRYNYSEQELRRLADELEWLEEGYGEVFCLFNNENMYENADRVKEILADKD